MRKAKSNGDINFRPPVESLASLSLYENIFIEEKLKKSSLLMKVHISIRKIQFTLL